MPQILKPSTLSLLFKVERRPAAPSFIVSIFGMFDLMRSDAHRFESEQALWPLAAKLAPPGRVLDIGMPKPCAEVLVGGYAASAEPVQRLLLEWAIGPVHKRLLVTGDRYWQAHRSGYMPTEPKPFQAMPLTPARSFGGAGHPTNPDGIGHLAEQLILKGQVVSLPNIEEAEAAIGAIGDQPRPASFGPFAVESPTRLKYAGTYDQAWLKTLAPGLASDVDPRLFLFAPEDQRLDAYLEPGEPYRLRHFSADAPIIQGSVPPFRARCFIGRADSVMEIALRIDTLWLFAGAHRGVVIYRGALPIEDIEGRDVTDVLIAYENVGEPARSTDHYLEVRALRRDPEKAFKYAFSESQLAPALPETIVARRREARRQAAEASEAAKRAASAWIVERELARAGLPPDLVPQPSADAAPPSIDLPLPLPEEIAEGEFDLAALLDAVDELMAKQQAQMEQLSAEVAPARAAMARLAQGDAEVDSVDALLAALGAGDGAAEIDRAMAELPEMPQLPAEADPEKAGEMAAALDKAKDWRTALLAAAQPTVDEAAQFALARAVFLGLPEGRPLHAVRGLLSGEGFTPPELPPLDPPAEAGQPAPQAGTLSIEDALRSLDVSQTPPGALEKTRGLIAEADAHLAKAFPRMAEGGTSPLETLLSQASTSGSLPTEEAIAKAETNVKSAIAEAENRITTTEDKLIDGLAGSRRAASMPIKPDTPLTPAVARQLGHLVETTFRAGESLAGRDLAGADLSGVDLAGADLSGAFLESAKLDGARLEGARLVEATLCGASLIGADLSRCDLTNANLCKVEARTARFAGSRLDGTSLLDAQLTEACFDLAILRNLQILAVPMARASFEGAQLSTVTFLRIDLSASRWRHATLDQVQCVEVDLTDATFEKATLDRVCFLMAQAARADFREATFARVAFNGGVDLTGASFAGVKAQNLSIQDATADDVDASAARMDGAYFGEASLQRASFRRASLKRAILARNALSGADFCAANLCEAQLTRADLTAASLRGANLFGADLLDATLLATDFSGANLTRTVFAVARDVA